MGINKEEKLCLPISPIFPGSPSFPGFPIGPTSPYILKNIHFKLF